MEAVVPWITVVGTYSDGSGQFSHTVHATNSADAAELVRRSLAPRESEVAGFFNYVSEPAPDPPDDEVMEAEEVVWPPE